MSRLSVDLIDSLAIIQGETYRELIANQSIQIPGDWSEGTPRGQIRTDIIANSGTLLAEFLFETSTYDAVSDTTTLNPYLTDGQTTAIAPTSYKAGRTPSVRNCYVADFEIELNGNVAKVAFGFVQVIGEVTGSGIPSPSTTETFLTAQNNLSEITDPAAARDNLGIVGGVKPDWNAIPGSNDEILNKPDLSIYATNDAVSIALANKEDVDSTILKESAIGVIVQPFNANTVIDSEYATVKSAAQSALQPVALNGYATEQFVLENAGGIDNGVVINGVANFWQPTPPTQRIDDSALVVGDRWFSPTETALWKGTYWLSETLYTADNLTLGTGILATISSSGSSIFPLPPIDRSVFIEKAKFTLLTNNTLWTTTDYYSLGSYVQALNLTTAGSSNSLNSPDTILINESYPGTVYVPIVFNYNLAIIQSLQYSHLLRLYITHTKFNNAPNIRVYGSRLEYRHILG